MGIKAIHQKMGKKEESRETWLEKILEQSLADISNVPRGGYFQVSSVGNSCDRLLYLHYHGLLLPEKITARQKRIFDHGTITQDRYEAYFKKMGYYEDKEVEANINDPPLHGRADFVLVINDKKYIIELKTINDDGFRKLEKSAKPDHEVQIQVYLNVLDIERGGILYENKNTQEVNIFAQRKNKDQWNKIVEKCKYIMELKEIPDINTIIHDKRYCKCIEYQNNESFEEIL